MNKKISYENLVGVITKSFVKKTQKNIGAATSLKFFDKLTLSIGFLAVFGTMMFVIGIGLAGNEEVGEVNVVSRATFQEVLNVSQSVVLIVKIGLLIFAALSIINLFPQKNLAHQMFLGTIYAFWLCISAILASIGMLWGATLGGFGPLGFCLQLILVIYLVLVSFRKRVFEIKEQLSLAESKSEKKSYTTLFVLAVIVLTLFNHFIFKFGYEKIDPKPIELLTGWGGLLWGMLLVGVIKLTFKQIFLTYYFARYDNEFYENLGFSDKEWYGPRKAKRLAKKKGK
ncbi:hypothetical protein GNF18_07255 [Ligilactobacillus pobuzihii]|uniref:hypothetical protein n=1 Tax=Ligilactobacillus pobuzihii TaxID=449659 RepID=UPI0019CF7D0A|nr:hypothetical protein [Ligilactobacillus pobuzihii]MBN7274932.1 hypothetical protein [Ligilactobacillus pobuzihii]